jgi:transcriptional antiterminator NusG
MNETDIPQGRSTTDPETEERALPTLEPEQDAPASSVATTPSESVAPDDGTEEADLEPSAVTDEAGAAAPEEPEPEAAPEMPDEEPEAAAEPPGEEREELAAPSEEVGAGAADRAEEQAGAAAPAVAKAPSAPKVPASAAAAPKNGEEAPVAVSPFEGPGDWYVVHTYAGYENKVKANLHSRIGSMQMEEKIFDVVIPMEDVMEIKGGRKQVVQKKVFPGYLLVKMIYDNDSWYVVRNTPGVTGFVSSGTGSKPTPLSNREVEKILAVKKETQRKPEYRLEWDEGDTVRIIAGPFADFVGTIAEINVEQSKLKVLVNIFDRETPVELAFDQVSKA